MVARPLIVLQSFMFPDYYVSCASKFVRRSITHCVPDTVTVRLTQRLDDDVSANYLLPARYNRASAVSDQMVTLIHLVILGMNISERNCFVGASVCSLMCESVSNCMTREIVRISRSPYEARLKDRQHLLTYSVTIILRAYRC